jgi:hypothetical protein
MSTPFGVCIGTGSVCPGGGPRKRLASRVRTCSRRLRTVGKRALRRCKKAALALLARGQPLRDSPSEPTGGFFVPRANFIDVADVAQLVERTPCKGDVVSSSLTVGFLTALQVVANARLKNGRSSTTTELRRRGSLSLLLHAIQLAQSRATISACLIHRRFARFARTTVAAASVHRIATSARRTARTFRTEIQSSRHGNSERFRRGHSLARSFGDICLRFSVNAVNDAAGLRRIRKAETRHSRSSTSTATGGTMHRRISRCYALIVIH